MAVTLCCHVTGPHQGVDQLHVCHTAVSALLVSALVLVSGMGSRRMMMPYTCWSALKAALAMLELRR